MGRRNTEYRHIANASTLTAIIYGTTQTGNN